MLGGFQLRYLAAVAEGRGFPAASATIPAIVRGMAARRARRTVSEIMLSSSYADDVEHIHRVAYLRTIDKEPPNHDDKEAIAKAFAEHRSVARENRAPWVLAASLGVISAVLAGGVIGARIAMRPAPRVVLPSTTSEVPLPSVALDPVREEVPAHPLEPVLREAIPHWVIALDAESAGRPRPSPDDVEGRHAGVMRALADARANEEIVTATRTLLEVAEEHSREASVDGDERITRALLAMDDAFARAGAPFYVDAVLTESVYGDRRRVLASSFQVRARRVFVSGERRITSLDLERIDELSFERALLGYTRPDVRYALVLTARVESYLVRQALPSIHSADESVIVRGYEDERDTGWVTSFENAVHEVLREEAGQVVAPEAIVALAAAMTRRRHAAERLAAELGERNLRLTPPETYAYDLTLLSGVLSLVSPGTRAEIRDAQAALDTPALEATYRAYEEVELLSIARHEAQHRIDYEDDRLIAVPDALAHYTGRTESEDRVNRLAERSNAELSAYLSQVAREPARARSHLVQIATFVMSRDSWGMPESYAALVIFEVIARELGLGPGELVVDRRIQRAEIARLFLELRGRPGSDVAAAATRAWQSLYGVPLPPLALEETR